MKKTVTSIFVLVSLDNIKSFYIKVDISDFATEAILSQQSNANSKWNLVAFFNKSLFLVEQNYEIHDKEMLVIIYTLCYMQVHPSGNYIPMVISLSNHIGLTSMVATFLIICLMAVMQPSRYSVFYNKDTPI